MIKTPAQFYKELGAEALAKRKNKIHTKKEIFYLKKYLNKKQRILDLACGYGRFTIPLAKQGYKIEGIGISPNLIAEAKKTAKKERLKLKFKVGDMKKLPYDDNSFDSIICMWSAFTELIKQKDQVKALKEMLRVLDNSGFAVLEMPESKIFNKKVTISTVNGLEWVPMCKQNTASLKNLMKIIKTKKYKIFVDDFGGRDRLLVLFWK